MVKRRMKSTLNIRFKHTFQAPCLPSAAIWHLHSGLQPGFHAGLYDRRIRCPMKMRLKSQLDSSAVKQSGGHT